jgi:hypothetical protein
MDYNEHNNGDLHACSREDRTDMEDISLCVQIVDETWFLVLSYLRPKEGLFSPDSLGDIFSSFGVVSKQHREYAIRYVQLIPQMFVYSFRRIPKLLWACSAEMNLGHVDFWDISSSTNGIECNLCLHMLRECNIKNLRFLAMGGIPCRRDGSTDIMSDTRLVQARFPNIPNEALGTPTTFVEFQREVVENIARGIKSLKEFHISCLMNELHVPMLNNFADSLVTLTLSLRNACCTSVAEYFLQNIAEAVQQMRVLETLKLNSHSSVPTPFSIKSKSLKMITTSFSSRTFWVNECICPALEWFYCAYFEETQDTNGVHPLFKVTDKELNVPLSVASYSFSGMHAPGSCVICLDCD